MKKNLMMRAASVLLVAVMLTTCAISGTFAKYTTAGNTADAARVAEFGVVISASGQLFGDTYNAADDNGIVAWSNANAGTVNSGTENDRVVAPGTKNVDGLVFGITGAPEVKVAVDFTVTGSDIVLKQGTGYDDRTTSTDTTDTFDVTGKDYNPVVFTLSQDVGSGYAAVPTAGNTLEEIAAYLDALDAEYDPNTNLATTIGSFKITWEWDFDDNGAGTYDKEDTLLGDLAVNPTLTAAANYSLNTAFSVNITVTQVD